MAVLSEGGRFLLSSETNTEDKSVLFVKLTDSALKAIEDFIRLESKGVDPPSIRFTGNDGQIWFPTEDPVQTRSFSFNCSSAMDLGGPQGSFECIQQCGNRSLDSLGQVTMRMSVNATDDVYERTRQKMVVAKEDSEKNCTRVLKSTTGLDIGKRAKLRGVKGAAHTVVSHRRDTSPVHRTHQNSSRPVTSNSSPNPVQGRLAPSSTSPVPVKGVSPNHNLPPVSNSPSPTTIPELMRRPLKERIIHLLAVRPYKKPEIHARLIRDGIRDKEKSIISTVLHSVANYKDNTYHLHRHIWNEVREDWPFYSEQERQLLKRRKPQNFTPPGSDSSGSNQSPSSTQPGNSPTSGKRAGAPDSDVPAKKQRISHFKKSTVSPPLSSAPLSYNVIGKPDSSQPTTWPDSRTGLFERNGVDKHKPTVQRVDSSEDLKPSVNKKSVVPEPELRRRTPSVNAKVTSSTGERGTPTPSSSPDSMHDVPRAGQNSPPLDSDCADFSEYLARYKPIANSEQRSRYRADFNRQYTEYMELHDVVDKVSQRFTQLEETLKVQEAGSSSWEEIKTQIVREYKANLHDTKFQEARRRYQYLHEKLAHIKNLINCYDRSRLQLCQS